MKVISHLLLIVFIFSSCSFHSSSKVKRLPSSILENRSFDASFTLLSGPEMPSAAVVIAKSLPNAPMRVDLLDVDPRIKCIDSSDGKQKVSFILPPASKGVFANISCTVAHNGSDYPEKVILRSNFFVLLDEIVIPEDKFATKNKLIAYSSKVTNREQWDSDFTNFVKLSVETRIVEIDTKSPTPVKIADGDPYFLSVEGFSGEYERKSFLKKEKITVMGKDERNKDHLYPEYNRLSLVCGTGVKNNVIQNVTNAEGGLFEQTNLKEPYFCHINKEKDSSEEKKNNGVLRVLVRTISYDNLVRLFGKFIDDEQGQIDAFVKAYHMTEFNLVSSNFNEVTASLKSWEDKIPAVRERIDADKFAKFRDTTINNLFPVQVQGTVSRDANLIKIVPVKKTIYDDSGNKKSYAYLSVTNAIVYRIATPEFVDRIDREFPFEERLNVYLATSTVFDNAITNINFVVCDDSLDNFYSTLANVQGRSNVNTKTFKEVSDELKSVGVSSIGSCKGTAKEKSNIVYSRGKGDNDYFIQWKKITDRKLEAFKVGVKFNADILGQSFSSDVTRDKTQLHPVFRPGVSLSIDPAQMAKFWQKDKDAYVIPYSADGFVKAGDK